MNSFFKLFVWSVACIVIGLQLATFQPIVHNRYQYYVRTKFNRVNQSAAEETTVNQSAAAPEETKVEQSADVNQSDLTTIEDVYISVKTSLKYHDKRAKAIVDTWFQLAPKSVFFFSDGEDVSMQTRTDFHLINTGCGATHERVDLACKLGQEYDSYLQSGRKFWCHFDDDTYVHIDNLVEMLSGYNSTGDHLYVGTTVRSWTAHYRGQAYEVEYATGGGFCISDHTAQTIRPTAENQGILKISDEIGFADDASLGFIICNLHHIPFTRSDRFHTHFENYQNLTRDMDRQIVLGYGGRNNIVDFPNATFPLASDPTRIYSLHCYFYPETPFCS